jgi:hypothetical protein
MSEALVSDQRQHKAYVLGGLFERMLSRVDPSFMYPVHWSFRGLTMMCKISQQDLKSLKISGRSPLSRKPTCELVSELSSEAKAVRHQKSADPECQKPLQAM